MAVTTNLSIEDKAKALESNARDNTVNGNWIFHFDELQDYSIQLEEIDDVVLALSCMYNKVNDSSIDICLYGDFEE